MEKFDIQLKSGTPNMLTTQTRSRNNHMNRVRDTSSLVWMCVPAMIICFHTNIRLLSEFIVVDIQAIRCSETSEIINTVTWFGGVFQCIAKLKRWDVVPLVVSQGWKSKTWWVLSLNMQTTRGTSGDAVLTQGGPGPTCLENLTILLFQVREEQSFA